MVAAGVTTTASRLLTTLPSGVSSDQVTVSGTTLSPFSSANDAVTTSVDRSFADTFSLAGIFPPPRQRRTSAGGLQRPLAGAREQMRPYPAYALRSTPRWEPGNGTIRAPVHR